jgi:hypothetical protein
MGRILSGQRWPALASRAAPLLLLLAMAAPAGQVSCAEPNAAAGPKGKRQMTMTEADRVFVEVDLDSNQSNACSPADPGPSWRGILIRAPSRAPLRRDAPPDRHGAFATIPICGYFLLDVIPDPTDPGFVLTAVDRATRKSYSGEISSLDESPVEPPPPSPPRSPSELKGLAAGGYFNTNLLWFVELPAAPAVYEVVATFKGQTSNKVTVELFEDDQK